ncbi:MAG: protein rep [Fischerella sp.]|nr:protein rep [Fischerella sp.]
MTSSRSQAEGLKASSAKASVKRDVVSAHPHLHILAIVPPSYFSHGYLSHAKQIDCQPIVYVSAIAKHAGIRLVIKKECRCLS